MVDKDKKNHNAENVRIFKEKNSVAYRLSNSLFGDESNRTIIKNVFYKHIEITPLDSDTKKIISNIQNIATDELNEFLKINLNFHLKQFVKQSRTSKAKIQVYYNKLLSIMNNDYKSFKANEEEILFQKISHIQKRLDEIEKVNSQKTDQLKKLKNEISDKISNVSEHNILKIEERKTKKFEIQEFLEEKHKKLDQKIKNSDLINEEIKTINDNVNQLLKEKENLIIDLNNYKISASNKIDGQFAEKEKNIAKLEIEKIEAYIWIRNCLVLLNRVIRDVEIELGLRRIENSWDKILGNFDEIKMQSSKIFNDFNFFDSIADAENKVISSKKINVDDRVVNVRSSEELVNE